MTIDSQLVHLRDAIQIDIGQRGLARDPVDNLFAACRDDFAAACRSIADHPAPRVGIVTGFMIPSVDPPTGETDGPPGALFLARVLNCLGIPCVLLSDRAGYDALWAGLEFLGLAQAVTLIDLPMNLEPETIAHSSRPITHLIALERSGPNASGRNHTMRGRDITEWTAPAHQLFEAPRDYGTIGIGDGGNEIGMGKIPRATIARHIPNGEQIACRTATDQLIVAGISNWGAWALAAGLLRIRNRVDLSLFDPDGEHLLLTHLVANGPLVDGVTGERTATVDGQPFTEYVKPLRRISQILASGTE